MLRTMKRLRFVGVGAALLAVVAMSAMAMASSASAVTFLLASWLVGGANVTATTLVESTGELLLENEKSFAGPASLEKCSGLLIGDVGPNSADDVTEVLTLAGVLVGAPLTGTAITCVLEAICESSSKVWAVNLPWLTEVELWEESPTVSGFVDLLMPHTGGVSVGWYVECKTALLTVSEECTTPEGVAEKLNEPTGVLDKFSDAFTTLMGAKLALCSGNNEETGVVEGTGLTTIPGGGVLSVSST